jgi:hypothetical protein
LASGVQVPAITRDDKNIMPRTNHRESNAKLKRPSVGLPLHRPLAEVGFGWFCSAIGHSGKGNWDGFFFTNGIFFGLGVANDVVMLSLDF